MTKRRLEQGWSVIVLSVALGFALVFSAGDYMSIQLSRCVLCKFRLFYVNDMSESGNGHLLYDSLVSFLPIFF